MTGNFVQMEESIMLIDKIGHHDPRSFTFGFQHLLTLHSPLRSLVLKILDIYAWVHSDWFIWHPIRMRRFGGLPWILHSRSDPLLFYINYWKLLFILDVCPDAAGRRVSSYRVPPRYRRVGKSNSYSSQLPSEKCGRPFTCLPRARW